MTTKNGDMPAMPIEFSGFGVYAPEAHYGLSKREMMAMHMMASFAKKSGSLSDWHDDAIDAVNAADALLAELERTK